MSVRLVVTGHGPDGAGKVVRDGRINPSSPPDSNGWEPYLIWGSDTMSTLPDDGQTPEYSTAALPPGSVRLAQLTLHPRDKGSAPHSVVEAAADDRAPAASLHHTPSVDVIVVLDGEVCLELDGGATVLRPGDFVVQNGTRHTWTNHGPGVARLAMVVLGTGRRGNAVGPAEGRRDPGAS
jgi:quercetin dioxygenase-like cupin family protein